MGSGICQPWVKYVVYEISADVDKQSCMVFYFHLKDKKAKALLEVSN